MNIIDKVIILNAGTFMITCLTYLEPILKISLLLISIGYTLHKWYKLKKYKK
jgi:hypothetical protein